MSRPFPPPQPPRATRRTWSHLEPRDRVPSEYELCTSKLLYHPRAGFEVEVPLARFHEQHQRRSPLVAEDWDRFTDPRQTTYSRYTELQSRREDFVDAIFERIEASGYDAALPPEARAFFAEAVAPLRYPIHGLQMLAASVGHLAPGGRIVIAAALQSADEMRRIQRIAYRLALLRRVEPGAGDDGRARWSTEAAWQPLRERIERQLLVFDWGEAFVALDLCLKPLFDTLVNVLFPDEARRRGDYLLGEVFASLDEDARWHREWSRALVEAAVAARGENREVLRGWIGRHARPAAIAVAALGGAHLGGHAGPRLASEYGAFLASLDLDLRDALQSVKEALDR